ncbi:uncharacterized protein LOC104451691 [Eucalyptus grandis]|uniref:uncharacterized protein LOC104451691 n=1 Tax=Eucalyptus grandis TaxID=71139 RepID=UPI00192E87BA|nr:uncharacterized protein LOC104451691 [Eucalyptus grandis]
MIQELKEEMMKTFEMTDLGLMHYFIGIEIDQNERFFISQKKYTENLLKKFKMNYCKAISTPLMTNEKLLKEHGAEKADASLYKMAQSTAKAKYIGAATIAIQAIWLQRILEDIGEVLSHLRSPAEELLDASVMLLDVCKNVREAFSQMKECVQELKFSLRRRKRGDSSFAFEVEAYISSTKKLNKVICKYLRNLKKKGSKKGSHNEATLSILTEAGEISFSVIGSLLGFLALTSARRKPRGWSPVSKLSKLLEPKRVSCDEGKATPKVQGLDAIALSLRSNKDINNQVGDLSKRLEELELSIQEIEDDLECIFRRLVKLRVSLLNIVSH